MGLLRLSIQLHFSPLTFTWTTNDALSILGIANLAATATMRGRGVSAALPSVPDGSLGGVGFLATRRAVATGIEKNHG